MSPQLRRVATGVVFVFAAALASCGGGGGTSGVPNLPPAGGGPTPKPGTSPTPTSAASSKPTARPSATPIATLPPERTPSPVPSTTPSPTADWSTFGYDLQRTGYNPNEKTIGPSTIGTLHPLWKQPAQIGTHMQGEPVVAMGVDVGGTKRNLLYAGGGTGVLYAIDADTGATVWTHQLPTIAFSCEPGQTTAWGIEGTAALDRAHNRLFVPDGQNQVHALDMSTGAEEPGWPIRIAPVTYHDFIHVGMNYNPSNGLLYAATSTTCDISKWYGRLTAIDAATASVVNTFYPSQGSSGGGIWGFGGASIDPSTNNVFIAVGNADDAAQQHAYYAEHVVELSSNLSVLAANYPPGMPTMSDSDFGTTPLLFQPLGCPPLVAAVNKSGAFVLYNRANIAGGPVQVIPNMSVTDGAASFRQIPAYDPVTDDVYIVLPSTIGVYRAGIGAFSVASDCTLNPTPVWNAVFGPDGAKTTMQATRSAITIANGVVYVSGYSDQMTHAFDAATGTPLWNAPLSGVGIVGPVVVDGRLYVGDASGAIHAWTP